MKTLHDLVPDKLVQADPPARTALLKIASTAPTRDHMVSASSSLKPPL